jgi:hypothetical protein
MQPVAEPNAVPTAIKINARIILLPPTQKRGPSVPQCCYSHLSSLLKVLLPSPDVDHLQVCEVLQLPHSSGVQVKPWQLSSDEWHSVLSPRDMPLFSVWVPLSLQPAIAMITGADKPQVQVDDISILRRRFSGKRESECRPTGDHFYR